MLTKQHYIVIARALRNAKTSFKTEHELELFDLIVSSFIAELTPDNERFNRDTFMAAIYGGYSLDTI